VCRAGKSPPSLSGGLVGTVEPVTSAPLGRFELFTGNNALAPWRAHRRAGVSLLLSKVLGLVDLSQCSGWYVVSSELVVALEVSLSLVECMIP
jgi:hypothetical protein